MTLTRWIPFREMEDLFDRFNHSFDRRPAPRGDGDQESLTFTDWAPSVDISETEKQFRIKVELPGVEKDAVKVAIHEGVLSIRGERKMEREEKGEKMHRVERAYGRFARSFMLPDNVDESTVTAEHEDGVLNVRLGKVEEAKPRSIEVKVA
jgi:HSP20 family protein